MIINSKKANKAKNEPKGNTIEKMIEESTPQSRTFEHGIVKTGKFVRYDEVTPEVAETFTLNPLSRKVNRQHVKEIEDQYLRYGDIMPPVIINIVTMHIIDGQHRVEAYLALMEKGVLPAGFKLRVMYVIIPEEDEIEAIIDANTHSKTWSNDDFIDCYYKAGKEPYIKLKEFCESHELTCNNSSKGKTCRYTYGAAIIMGRTCRKELKTGKFNPTPDDYRRAEIVHDELLKIRDTMGLDVNPGVEAMVSVWCPRREFYDFSKVLAAISSHPTIKSMPTKNKAQWELVFLKVFDLVTTQSKKHIA